LENYIKKNFNQLKKSKKIKLLDIGPCGGAITTLFALRSLDKFNLLDKVEIYLLDIVPDVINLTKKRNFDLPKEMIKEYGFGFAGESGQKYKKLMQSNKVKGIIGDGETLPKTVRDMDIVLAGYLHHHMNLITRKNLAAQMERATKKGGFIGVVDFYVQNYEEYMNWYRPHFTKHKTPPPVECPLLDGNILSSWYKNTSIKDVNNNLEKSFTFWGIKK
ncbi:class I SAM-dependent methyltransferase, partial [Nanoarchaeota archaeon]